jgi:putative ABC transport system permease protein
MNLVGLAARNLKRRPIRTSLSILGIGLAVGAALALIALSRSIQDSTREGMNELGDDLVVMQKGASDIFGGFIPERTVERVAALPGIARVSGEMVTFAMTETNAVLTLGWPMGAICGRRCPCARAACRPPANAMWSFLVTPRRRRSARSSATKSS